MIDSKAVLVWYGTDRAVSKGVVEFFCASGSSERGGPSYSPNKSWIAAMFASCVASRKNVGPVLFLSGRGKPPSWTRVVFSVKTGSRGRDALWFNRAYSSRMYPWYAPFDAGLPAPW